VTDVKTKLLRLGDLGRRSFETHLVLMALGVAAFIGLSIYHVVAQGHGFDAAAYGEGLGFLLAGGGAASWGRGLQRKAEANGIEVKHVSVK
jgi:hypothetical protein